MKAGKASKMSLTQWVAVDFDHTLVDIDKPLVGARDAMLKLKELGYGIMIHSCNNVEWIKKVLRKHDIPFDYIWNPSEDKGKPVCFAYVDDRGVGFNGDWNDAISQIVNLDERRSNILGTWSYNEKHAEAEAGEEQAGLRDAAGTASGSEE